MSTNKFIQVQTDEILLKEAAKRAFRDSFTECAFTLNDCKGEVFKIMQQLTELQRAINMGDTTKIKKNCILANKRLRLIFNEFK